MKDDYLTDTGIRSRFKREYNITKSLQDAFGIIRVYTFDEGSISYTMEYAETTLDKYVKSFDLTDDIQNLSKELFELAEKGGGHLLNRVVFVATSLEPCPPSTSCRCSVQAAPVG